MPRRVPLVACPPVPCSAPHRSKGASTMPKVVSNANAATDPKPSFRPRWTGPDKMNMRNEPMWKCDCTHPPPPGPVDTNHQNPEGIVYQIAARTAARLAWVAWASGKCDPQPAPMLSACKSPVARMKRSLPVICHCGGWHGPRSRGHVRTAPGAIVTRLDSQLHGYALRGYDGDVRRCPAAGRLEPPPSV